YTVTKVGVTRCCKKIVNCEWPRATAGLEESVARLCQTPVPRRAWRKHRYTAPQFLRIFGSDSQHWTDGLHLRFHTSEFCCKFRNGRFQFLHLVMLFEKLIEQHRVHHLVAHAFHLAFVIAIYQSRVHFFYLLSDQAKTQRLRGVKLLFKPEADWFECVKPFARPGEGLDVLLVTLGGNNSGVAKPPVAESDCDVIVNSCAKTLCQPVHVADIRPDADTSLAVHSLPDANIATAGDVSAGCSTQGCVVVADVVENERLKTDGRITNAFGVARERPITAGSISIAVGVASQRLLTGSRVEVAHGVAKEGSRTDCRV